MYRRVSVYKTTCGSNVLQRCHPFLVVLFLWSVVLFQEQCTDFMKAEDVSLMIASLKEGKMQ